MFEVDGLHAVFMTFIFFLKCYEMLGNRLGSVWPHLI